MGDEHQKCRLGVNVTLITSTARNMIGSARIETPASLGNVNLLNEQLAARVS